MRTTVAIVATLLVVVAARRVVHVLLLVVVAFVLAVGLDPAVQWLARLRMRRGLAVAVIFLGLALFLALFVALLVPLLTRQTQQFAAALPGYLVTLQGRDDWLGNAVRQADVAANVQQFVAEIPAKIRASFSSIVGVAGTVLGRVFDVCTVAVLCIYFMLALPGLPSKVAAVTSPNRRAQVDRTLRRSFEKVGGYVSGNLLTSAVCGAATVMALLALGVDYAVPLGIWAGVADLVPQIGAYLGAVPAVLVALAEGPGHAVATVLFFVVYQQFENYVLAPRVYRNAIDLSPAAVIVATLCGATLAGFAGALLALPVAATIKVVFVDVVLARRLESTREPAGGVTDAPDVVDDETSGDTTAP